MLTGKGILSPIQQSFLAMFSQIPDQDQFYLAGGTALAEYYLGHRLSYDLDIFTAQEPLILPVSYQVEKCGPENNLEITVNRRFASYVEFLAKKAEQQLKVDLALDSPFRFRLPVITEMGFWVNDFEDIKVDKLLAYYGRSEPRDAIDLYFLLQQESLQDMMNMAAQKDPGFDLYWFAVALSRAESFPDEIERWPVKMLLPCNAIEIKKSFLSLANELMQKLLS